MVGSPPNSRFWIQLIFSSSEISNHNMCSPMPWQRQKAIAFSKGRYRFWLASPELEQVLDSSKDLIECIGFSKFYNKVGFRISFTREILAQKNTLPSRIYLDRGRFRALLSTRNSQRTHHVMRPLTTQLQPSGTDYGHCYYVLELYRSDYQW